MPSVPPIGELRAYLGASHDARLSSSQAPSGTGPLLWNGAPLLACGARPCGSIDGGHRRATARLVGTGMLALEGSSLRIDADGATPLVVTLAW